MAEGADVEILTALYIFFFNKIILKKQHKFHTNSIDQDNPFF